MADAAPGLASFFGTDWYWIHLLGSASIATSPDSSDQNTMLAVKLPLMQKASVTALTWFLINARAAAVMCNLEPLARDVILSAFGTGDFVICRQVETKVV